MLEVNTSIDATQVVVDKNRKMVHFVSGNDLQFIAEVKHKGDIVWADTIPAEMRSRAGLLISQI